MVEGVKTLVVTAEYFLADSSQAGSHKLFFKDGKQLTLIEFFDEELQFLYSKEFRFDARRKELIITRRNSAGQVLDSRIIPK